MKTVIFYVDGMPTLPFYFIADGDYRHLNGIFINGNYIEAEGFRLAKELRNLLLDEHGNHKLARRNLEDVRLAVLDGAHLIAIGY